MSTAQAFPLGKANLSLNDLEDLRSACFHYSLRCNDKAFLAFYQAVECLSPQHDSEKYFAALHRFLRTWNCRNLAGKDEALAVSAFISWYRVWGNRLQDSLQEGYQALVSLVIARRLGKDGREVLVRMGHTAASKFLFALEPHTFPAWNRRSQVLFDSDYPTYLLAVKQLIQERILPLCIERQLALTELPSAMGRPHSTLMKLLDEAISRGILFVER